MIEKFPVEITTHDETPEEAGIIDAGLDAANRQRAPLDDVAPLCCFARLQTGEVVGGLIGRTWGRCSELRQLWVEPDFRGKGIGRRLVEAYHRQAAACGCTTFFLETFSFQSPSLYESLGYEVKVAMESFPAEIVKYVMVRDSG